MPDTRIETPSSNGRSWLDGFRRITTSGNYIPEIDGIRFIAVSLVVVYHVLVFVAVAQGTVANDQFVAWNTAARGVEMFFVLSGFVLALPFASRYLQFARPVRMRDYFVRRVTRLELPYLVALFLYTALKVATNHQWWPSILGNTLFSVVYSHNAIVGEHSVAMSVAWSLEVEVQFYLLMPLLAYVFRIRDVWLRRGVLVATMLASASVQPIALPAVWGTNTSHLLNAIQYFLAGLLLADVWLVEWGGESPRLSRRKFLAWGDIVCIIVFAFILLRPVHHLRFDQFALAPLIFLMYIAMFCSASVRNLMRGSIVTVIGGMCYSIYLMHNLVIQLVGRVWYQWLPQNFVLASILSIVVMAPAVLVVCAVYYRAIELPCMRRDWPQRLWSAVESRIFVVEDEVDGSTAPPEVSMQEATPPRAANKRI